MLSQRNPVIWRSSVAILAVGRPPEEHARGPRTIRPTLLWKVPMDYGCNAGADEGRSSLCATGSVLLEPSAARELYSRALEHNLMFAATHCKGPALGFGGRLS